MKVNLYRRYSKLDNRYEYQVEVIKDDTGFQKEWLWYYLGRYIVSNFYECDGVALFPFTLDYLDDNPKIKTYSNTPPMVARRIADIINRNPIRRKK